MIVDGMLESRADGQKSEKLKSIDTYILGIFMSEIIQRERE